jgi:histone deacetylase 1/2
MATGSPAEEIASPNASLAATLPATNKDSSKSGLTHSLTIKLDENNFLLWSQQVNGVITAHNLHRFVVNPQIPLQFASTEDRVSGKNSDEYQQWLIKDQTLFTWLLSTLSDGVLPRVLSCRHAHEVWDKIHKYFNSVLKSRARQLRSELKNTKKLSRSINEYLLRIKTIVNSLTAVGDFVSESEQVDSILEGLPEDFNSFVMMIYSRFDTPTVEDVEALLLLQEAQFEKFKQELANPSVSANIAHTEVQSSESTYEPESHEIGTEHYNAVASRGRGRGKGRGSKGRGKAPASNQGKVICQICGKPNHDAVGCWYRFDPQAMKSNSRGNNVGSSHRPPNFNPYMRPSAHLAMPQSHSPMFDMSAMSSSAWYPDSGASHHLTFNPNNLSYSMPYNGQDQVMMGNGQGVSINSLGHSNIISPRNPNVQLSLKDLLHVPTISKNLLSVSKFAQDNNVIFEFHPYTCFVKSQDSRQVLLEGTVGADGLYQFKPFKFLPAHAGSLDSTFISNANKSVNQVSTLPASFSQNNCNGNFSALPNSFNSCNGNFSALPNSFNSAICNNTTSVVNSDNNFHLWHLRLGHAHSNAVKSVLKLCNVSFHSIIKVIHFLVFIAVLANLIDYMPHFLLLSTQNPLRLCTVIFGAQHPLSPIMVITIISLLLTRTPNIHGFIFSNPKLMP